MAYRKPARVTPRRIPRTVADGLLVVIAAIAVGLGYHLLASSLSTAASPTSVVRTAESVPAPAHAVTTEVPRPVAPAGAPPAPQRTDLGPGTRRSSPRAALGEAGGVVPDGTTVFDDDIPAIANLDPALLGALRRAATDAANDRGEFVVESGWRSPEYQEQLLQQAVAQYGSEAEAARWVATPATSAHVTGDAVDIGLSDAAAWLSKHGVRYGLCQIYRNEPWHFELRLEATDHGCPPMYADPARDPRMQQ